MSNRLQRITVLGGLLVALSLALGCYAKPAPLGGSDAGSGSGTCVFDQSTFDNCIVAP